MQLKRDTDYAIRILFCLKETIETDPEREQKKIALSEIAAQARIPKTTALRICGYLSEKGMIHLIREGEDGENEYYAAPLLLERSLLDVIEAVEGTGRIFAVFDRKSHMYRKCGKGIEKLQRKHERLLSSASLEGLIGKKE
ncbi:MAG: Rrf2 family transcriptional regulator [Oscillospiraceae bacterium]|nr:Rrf2 family transcriptional regulator [Oscillospiraceae bacterium]